ncbi:MAG TPA: ABC transporter permease [Nitrososphaera sp.]
MAESSTNNMIPVRQAFLIAYMTGVLWLRRNPTSLVFTAISPFSLLFVLYVISGGGWTDFAIAGSLVMALVGYGLALGQDISFYKTEYKVQDVFVASPVSPITYMMGLALSELLFGLPALVVLASLVVFNGGSVFSIPLLVTTILLIWGSMSAMGFFLSSHMLHMRNATQIISFVNVILTILPPVFYPITFMPDVLEPLAYAVPTTHASLMLQYIMGEPTPADWSLGFGFAVQIAYVIGFVALARTKAIWRDN